MSIKGPQTPQTLTAQQQIEQAQLAVDETKEVTLARQQQLEQNERRFQALNNQVDEGKTRIGELLDRGDALAKQRDRLPPGRARDALNRQLRENAEQTQAQARTNNATQAALRENQQENQVLVQEYNQAAQAETDAIRGYNQLYRGYDGVPGTAPQAVRLQQSAPGGLSPSPEVATAQVAAPPTGAIVVQPNVPLQIVELPPQQPVVPVVVDPVPVRVDAQAGPFVFGPDGELIPADSAEGQAILAERGPLTVTPPAVADPPDPAAAGAEAREGERFDRTNDFVYGPNGELLPAENPYSQSLAQRREADAVSVAQTAVAPQPVGGNFTQVYNPETGKWDVYNLDNPDVPVKTGLSEQAAILDAQNLSVGDPGYGGLAARNFGVAYDDNGFLLPGYTLDEDNNPVYVGGDFVEPATAASAEASRVAALTQQARDQATVRDQRKASGAAAGDGDWRVRLRLAPNATYLYKTPGLGSAGIMEPLRQTDGVVFPYTPKIDMAYQAEYTPYDLVHSNYRGYFYKGSRVGEVSVTADFTAQDSTEADYLLAVIHFFRSATKMFYGQDKQRGTPPPLVFLSGLGEFQFNEHPCVISQFNYSLPSDVDYIRSRGRQSTSAGITQGGNGLMFRRTLASSARPSYSLSSIWDRLTGANLPQGGMNIPPAPPNLGLSSPTYVPTKISLSLTLLPMPTRSQVSQQFSLEKFANGNLLRGGFW